MNKRFGRNGLWLLFCNVVSAAAGYSDPAASCEACGACSWDGSTCGAAQTCDLPNNGQGACAIVSAAANLIDIIIQLNE